MLKIFFFWSCLILKLLADSVLGILAGMWIGCDLKGVTV